MSELYMTIEYCDTGTGQHGPRAPSAIYIQMQGPHGPEFATVDWDAAEPGHMYGSTYRITTAVRVNGTHGLAAFTMYDARLLRVDSVNGPINVQSVRFGQKPKSTGITLSGTPMLSSGTSPDTDISHYLNRNGLFIDAHVNTAGGMAAIWFHADVNMDSIDAFLKRHPKPPLGMFAHAAVIRDGKTGWRLGYLYSDPDAAARDLAMWKSDDTDGKADTG